MDLEAAIDSMLAEAHDDPVGIAEICSAHRQKRNSKFKEILLRPGYAGVPIDGILTARLMDPRYLDPRNNLCIFAWPPREVTDLILRIQQDLLALAPNLWLSPVEWLHMTVIELAHSKSPAEIKAHAEQAMPHAAGFIEYAAVHPAILDRPMLSLDDTAVALTFLPAEDERYTYLHLRRDLAHMCAASGVAIASKYYNTSSHVTFARFAKQSDLTDEDSLKAWVGKIEAVNQGLREEYWPRENCGDKPSHGLRWTVGEG